MMIRVMYHNGQTEMVRPPLLRHLISTGKIRKFRRADGWATLGVDKLRDNGTTLYEGKERRGRVALP